MSISPVRSVWQILYPYLVVARVCALLLASLVYLVLYHAIRDRFSASHSAEPQKDLQQIN
ncbi:hypothetical protein [Leptolyngbya sp. FACHB-711]|uniref:hypothetical protein n=1 Tax=unclassified Leptolyngbya TaxID=2650499 RepID=UPI001687A4B6|nr:hypothetical protein [Leptolyngbya sp. FACHB-711]MBD1852729.1 hypothetical protein [Cyanobacteria bacterium FACHB-502]MBD2022897.1 hypothetical protein [Leptolyngbya sp. FACHB-711]